MPREDKLLTRGEDWFQHSESQHVHRIACQETHSKKPGSTEGSEAEKTQSDSENDEPTKKSSFSFSHDSAPVSP